MEEKGNGGFGVGFFNDAQISDEEIQRVFSKYGPIIDIWKGSNTLVFVNFKYKDDAEQCLSDSSLNGKYSSAMRGKFEPVKVQSKRKYKSIDHRSIPSDSSNTSDNLQYNEDPKSEEMYTHELNKQVPVQRKYPKEKLQTGGQSEIKEHIQNSSLRYPADSQHSSAFQSGSFHKQFQKMNISSEDAYQDTTNNISARRPGVHFNRSNGNSTTGRYQGSNHGRLNGYDSHDANLYKQFPAAAPKKGLLPTPHVPLLSSNYQEKEYDNCDVHFNRSNGNSTTGRYQGSNRGRLNGYDSHDQNDANLYKQFPAAAPKKALLPTPHVPLLSSNYQGKEYDNCGVHFNRSNGNSTTGRYQGSNRGRRNGYDSHDQNDANLYKQFPAAAPKKALLPTPNVPLLSSTNEGKEYDNCDVPPPLVSSDAGPPPLCSTRSFRHEYDNCDHFNRSNGNSTTGKYQGSNHGRLNGYDTHDQNDANLYKQFPAAAPKKALLPTPNVPLLSSTNEGKEYDNCDVPPPSVSSDAGPPPLCSTREFRHECSILLANIPLSITPTEVYEIFATLAPVYISPVYETYQLHLPFCLVRFLTPTQACKALDDFDDTLLYGKHVLIRNLNDLMRSKTFDVI